MGFELGRPRVMLLGFRCGLKASGSPGKQGLGFRVQGLGFRV